MDSARALVPETIQRFFQDHPRVALAYSGGCDSVFLLACAKVCGAQIYPVTVDTAFQYAFEEIDARQAADQIGVKNYVIHLDILAHPEVVSNPPDCCYRCKKVIFSAIRDAAAKRGIEVIIDGTNASDDPKRRPGFRALKEFGVRSPLREAGLTKDDIRSLSHKMGLITADKPSYSCLATRIEANQPITRELLESFVQEDWRNRETHEERGSL